MDNDNAPLNVVIEWSEVQALIRSLIHLRETQFTVRGPLDFYGTVLAAVAVEVNRFPPSLQESFRVTLQNTFVYLLNNPVPSGAVADGAPLTIH